jgi:hypothetical protein
MKFEDLKKYNIQEIKSAGPRYTPGQDKNAPNLRIQELEEAFDALSLSTDFKKRQQNLERLIAKGLEESSYQVDSLFKRKKRSPLHLKNLIAKLSEASPQDASILIREIKIVIKAINKAIRKREDKLFQLERNEREKSKEGNEIKTSSQTQSSRYDHERYYLRRFEENISEIRSYFNSEAPELILNNCLLLIGEWGTGKTHSLCDFVKKLTQNNHFCVFSIAQNFPLNTDPLDAICQRSKLAKNIDDLLAGLENIGQKNKYRTLLVVDGINEGDREEWKTAVITLLDKVRKLKHVGLILSCRSPFEHLIFSEKTLSNYKVLYHEGFREIEFEAQEEFFKYYKIAFPEVPLLSDEFARPLTLKLICKALEKLTVSKKKSAFSGIASGQKGMNYILEKYIQDLGGPIEKAFKLPSNFCWTLLKGTKKTKDGLKDGIAVRMAREQKEVLSHDEVLEVILNTTQWTSKEDAQKFLKAVVHSGILFEHYIWTDEGYVDAIKLPYQKFSDHIIARHLLDHYLSNKSLAAVKRSFNADRPLGRIFEISRHVHQYEMPNWAEALMIEFPERIKKLNLDNRELVYFLPKNKRLVSPSLEPFLNSLLWRPPSSFCHGTNSIVSQLLEKGPNIRNRVLDTLLALAVKRNHPYKAQKLDRFLFQKTMPERDLQWSEFLRTSDSADTPYKIISWSKTVSTQRVSKSVAENCIIILMWFLTSVSKPQRDTATEAIIKLGFLYPDLVFKQTLYSLTVNDPYVSERMLSAAYGIAMNKWAENRKKFREPFLLFAKELVKEMFLPNSKWATHNAISRDCALGCIEIACLINKNAIPRQYVKYLKPPFSYIKSPFKNPRSITKKKTEAVKSAIYMDFRNYTIGRLIPGRGNYQDKHTEYQAVLKQIKGRVYDLGYRSKDFEEIDKEISRYQRLGRSEYSSKIDRYGKKYSWIAFYEMYGYREANKLLRHLGNEHRISEITFDPSIPEPPKPCPLRLPNLFRSKFKNFSDWLANGPTPNYKALLVRDSIRGEVGPWVLLDGFIHQANQIDQREIFSFTRGLLIEEKNISKFKEKYFSKDYPGNRSIPEAHTDYYAFAGEIPWSRQHAYYLRHKNGRIKRHVENAFGGNEFIPYKRRPKNSLSIAFEKSDSMLSFILGESPPSGRWVNVPGVPVEIPVHGFGWESYHSVVNDYSGYDVPTPAISNYLELNYRNQSIELFDRNGKRATIFMRLQEPDSHHSTHLMYLRQDLLERYLAHTGQTIVWAIWGERDANYKAMDQRNAEARADKIWEEYKHIHRTFTKYKDIV